MRKLLLIAIAAVLFGSGAIYSFSAIKRQQLIRSEIEKLNYRNSAKAVRDAAVTLGWMGPDAEEAIPVLVEVLMRNEPPREDPLTSLEDVKYTIAGALVSIGPASVEPLLNAVRDSQNRARGWGIRPDNHLRVPPLFDALDRMRRQSDMEFDSSAIDETLNELMANHDCHDVRLWAGMTLGVIELKSHERIPYPPPPSWNSERKRAAYWTVNLENEDPFARAWAAHILGENASVLSQEVVNWTEALPAVAVLLGDVDKLVREESAHSLYKLVSQANGEARDVVPALIDAIQGAGKRPDPSWSFYEKRMFASLGLIGADASAAVPTLLSVLEDTESEFRSNAANALGRIGDVDAIPLLVNSLEESDDPTLVAACANALGCFGPNAKLAVPRLIKLLEDDRIYSFTISIEHSERQPNTVRDTVLETLEKIDPETARQLSVRD